MFGLEESGFVVCLGLILFLIGLVMFYVRQRFSEQDDKLNQLISIIPVMTQQIQLHEQELHPDMYHPKPDTNEKINNLTVGGEIDNNTLDNKIDVSPNDSEDSDSSGSDSDSDSDSGSDSDAEAEVKNIRLGSELSLQEVTTLTDVEDQLQTHVKETILKDTNNDQTVLNESNENKTASYDSTVRVVTIKDNNDNKTNSSLESENESSDESPNADSSTMESPNMDDDLDEIDIPITHNPDNVENLEDSVDYTKLSVAALRQIISKKGLSTHTSKLRKNECLELLQ